MKKAVLLVALATVGCGSSGDRPPSIAGNWIAPIGACDAYLDMTATEFMFGDVCLDANGTTVDASATKGTYTYDGETWLTFNTASSCTGTAAAFRAPLTLSGGALTMSDDTGAITFTRNASPATGGIVTYGCFSNGAFTASPLAPL